MDLEHLTEREGELDVSISRETMVYVARPDQIPEGEALRVDVPSLPEAVAVFRSDGRLFALSDTCSHGAASLAEGWVEDCRVACPLHFSEFDLATGVPCSLPAMTPVRTYEVRVRDDAVYIALADPADH